MLDKYSMYKNISYFVVLISLLFPNILYACDTSPTLSVGNVIDNGDGTYYMDISACIGTEGSADGFDLYFNNDINILATTVEEVTSPSGNTATVNVNNGIWLAYFDEYNINGTYFEQGIFGGDCIDFGVIVDDNPEGATICSVGMNEDCLGFTQNDVFITCGVIPGPCMPNYSITDNGSISSDVSIAGQNCNFAPFNDEIIELTVTCDGTFNFSLAQDAGFWASESWLTLALECCNGVIEQTSSFFESPITMETYLTTGTYFLIVDVYSDNFTPGTYTLDISSSADLSLVTEAIAGQDQLICDESTTLNANPTPLSNESGTWTVISGSGQFIDENNPNSVVNNLSEGNNVFQWEISNECSNSTDEVIIEVANNILFDIPETIYCLEQIPLNVLGEENNGIWSIEPNLTAEIDDINANNTFANVSAYGEYIISYTICDETFTTNTSVLSISPELSSSQNQYYCLEDFQLNANINNDPGYWEYEGPSIVNFNNITSLNPIVSVEGYGTYTFTYYGCGDSNNIIIDMIEEQPNITGPNEIYCLDQFNLEADVYADEGYWDFEGPGNAIFTNQNSLSTLVNVDSYGTYIFTYYGCGTSNIIEINSLEAEPQILTINNQVIYCNLEVILEATVLGDQGYWEYEGPGNITFTNQNNLITSATADSYGTYNFTYYGCGGTSNICSVNFETIEPEINIDGNISCELTTQLSGNVSGNEEVQWFINNSPDNTTANISDAVNINTELNVSDYGTYEIGLTACGITTYSLVEFNPVPPHIISPNFQNCILNATLIAYTDDTNNPGPWSQISGPSGVIFSDPSQSVTNITVPQFGLYTFKYESCDTFSTTVIGFECPLEFPNSMTPNGDGNNDYFIINNLNPEIYSKSILTIYNRWGGVMYTSTEYGLNNNWWDGKTTYENKLVTDGIYYYILETYNNINNQKEEHSGELHLFISNSSSINKDHKLEINNRN